MMILVRRAVWTRRASKNQGPNQVFVSRMKFNKIYHINPRQRGRRL
jgi:hypothetical protein